MYKNLNNECKKKRFYKNATNVNSCAYVMLKLEYQYNGLRDFSDQLTYYIFCVCYP